MACDDRAMNNALHIAHEPFVLVTTDGFSLQGRDAKSGELFDAALGEKSAILVAFLGLVQAAVPRLVLCDLLWTDADNGRARNSLRQSLFRIRKVMGARAIIETAEGVLLTPGLVEIDLVRALRRAPTGAAAEIGGRLASAFGSTERPIGRNFEDWCARVRRQLAQGEILSTSAPSVTFEDREQGALAGGTYLDQVASQRLAQLFRLSLQGIPLAVWVMGRPEVELRHGVEEFVSACQAQGASVAAVPRRAGAGYARFALERELAEVLWPLPGAAGLKPDFHTALVRLQRGFSVESALLRESIVDLIAAISENGPLVITLGDPGRYSLGALTGLVTELTALRDRPVLFMVTEHSGVRPVHSACIEVHLGGVRATARQEEERQISA